MVKSDDPWSTSSSDVSLIRAVNWNLDQNLGETYEYVPEIVDRGSRVGFSQGILTSVCVSEQDKNKISTV